MIYYLKCEASGLTKIGKSTNVFGRIRDIQRMGGMPLVLVALLVGYTDEERELHRLHASKRRHGEWFALDPEDVPDTEPAAQRFLGPVESIKSPPPTKTLEREMGLAEPTPDPTEPELSLEDELADLESEAKAVAYRISAVKDAIRKRREQAARDSVVGQVWLELKHARHWKALVGAYNFAHRNGYYITDPYDSRAAAWRHHVVESFPLSDCEDPFYDWFDAQFAEPNATNNRRLVLGALRHAMIEAVVLYGKRGQEASVDSSKFPVVSATVGAHTHMVRFVMAAAWGGRDEIDRIGDDPVGDLRLGMEEAAEYIASLPPAEQQPHSWQEAAE